MSEFSNHLGELAGQDIVLWREAGLDPLAGKGNDHRLQPEQLVPQAFASVGRMCRWLVNTLGGDARRTRPSLAYAHVFHVHFPSKSDKR